MEIVTRPVLLILALLLPGCAGGGPAPPLSQGLFATRSAPVLASAIEPIERLTPTEESLLLAGDADRLTVLAERCGLPLAPWGPRRAREVIGQAMARTIRDAGANAGRAAELTAFAEGLRTMAARQAAAEADGGAACRRPGAGRDLERLTSYLQRHDPLAAP